MKTPKHKNRNKQKINKFLKTTMDGTRFLQDGLPALFRSMAHAHNFLSFFPP